MTGEKVPQIGSGLPTIVRWRHDHKTGWTRNAARVRNYQLLGRQPRGATRWYADLLGIEPYFIRDGYVEFRLGDSQDELGIIDRRFAPPSQPTEPGGAVMYWHVDDLRGTYQVLLDRGATPYQPPIERGDGGFVTASVVDPFGNVLGIMYNPHYIEVLAARG